jgi:hypothetical protein
MIKMKPTKPGFYWYRGEPVKVWTHEWSGKVIVCFEQIGKLGVSSVSSTKDCDWGPEIKMEKRCNGCGCILKVDDLCFDCFEYSEIKGDGDEKN